MRSRRGIFAKLARAAIVAGWFGAVLSSGALADVYAIDPDHTNVSFSWDHLGVSRQSARMLVQAGSLEFDPAAPQESGIDVTLNAASISTGNTALDRDLKSSDFFDVKRYPEITFRSTGIKVTGEKIGEVEGNLTIMGETQPVVLQVRWNYTGEHPLGKINPTYKGKFVSGFSARTSILRSAWGLKRAIPLVSDEIEISIEAEFLRK